jgi:hypothetical protein
MSSRSNPIRCKRTLHFDAQVALYTLQCPDDLSRVHRLRLHFLRQVFLRRQPAQPTLRRIGFGFGRRLVLG